MRSTLNDIAVARDGLKASAQEAACGYELQVDGFPGMKIIQMVVTVDITQQPDRRKALFHGYITLKPHNFRRNLARFGAPGVQSGLFIGWYLSI